MKRLFGMRSRPVANDSGMPLVKKEQPMSSRRVADTQKTDDGFFQRMGNLVRSRRVAPIPVIKPEPKILTTISDRSRSSKKLFYDDDTIYSPFDLESSHSTSRNRTSKRSPLRDQKIEGVRNLLQKLDSSQPNILNHLTLKKYLNGRFDLSGITEIQLYRDLLKELIVFNDEIITLLKLTLQQSNNIETIEIDVPYLIPVLLELEPYKLSTIKRLILRSDYESPKPITDDDIFVLLNMIGKMDNLEELEFSNFKIDVGKFKGFTLNDLFSSIVKLKKLQKITFKDNIFSDYEKETGFDDFQMIYFSKDGVRRTNLDRIRILVEWIINNSKQNIDDLDAYKAYIHSNFWKTHVQQQNRYNRMKHPDDSKEKQAYLKERRSNLPKISDVKFDDFLKDKEEVKRWLIWLIKNESDIRVKGDIVERLRIVIEYFKYKINDVIQFLSENPSLQTVIITEFDKIWHTYQPNRINDDYNRMIKDVLGNKLVKSRGGRKAPKKPPTVARKATKKPPKQPKVSLKAPKKPTKPKVSLKAPKKPTKPKVSLKAPTKQPKIARKATKKR